jgi:hypothetical protein
MVLSVAKGNEKAFEILFKIRDMMVRINNNSPKFFGSPKLAIVATYVGYAGLLEMTMLMEEWEQILLQ